MKKPRALLPWMGLAALVLVSFHFLALRIGAAGWPSGDEGSWMSVATELSRGHGFTTRWLEFHWLDPYALPRPDDFRYPGLSLALAGSFTLFGTSYPTALGTVAALFLAFMVVFFLTLRRAHGVIPALLGTALLALSPLQLEWNSRVYTECLFGLMLSILIFLSLSNRVQSKSFWILLGIGVALSVLVRPNGYLLVPGFFALWWFRRREGARLHHALLACAAMTLFLSPWLIRNGLIFGNPFHIAGSGGLLRAQHVEPATFTLGQYLGREGLFFPLQRMVLGLPRFFQSLHFFEHGLEALPLLLALISFIRTRRFLNPFVITGFALTFTACCYASYNSWAGLRYFSAFLPFVYAAGAAELVHWANRPASKGLRRCALAATVLLFLPVLNPHRFYERHYGARKSAAPAIAAHHKTLETLLPPDGIYYAKNLCQLNFATTFRCVGLQELHDSTWFVRSEREFQPRLIALRRGEDSTADLRDAMVRFGAAGFGLDTVASTEETFYLEITSQKEQVRNLN